MCVIDDGETCTIWNERHQKARKEHRCNCCKRTIQIGEEYLTHFSVFEGEATSEKMCSDCEKDRKEFADAHHGILFPPGSLKAVILNCIGESVIYDDDSEDEDGQDWKPLLQRIRDRK